MRRAGIPECSVVDHFNVDCASLTANHLGEPSERAVSVWRPVDRDTEGLPLILFLASYLNSGPSLTSWRVFGESVTERLDRIYHEGTMGPAVVVFIDSFNRLGGNQFVNSPIIGNWTDALADDLVPEIERRYGCGGAGRRAVIGHSSGGYGALYNLASRPDVWSAAASHAGDCGFDWVYRADLPKALRVLEAYDFHIEAFLDAFWKQEKPKGEQVPALMMLAMAASYDPCDNPHDFGIQLPVTHDTCEFIEERWQNWLSYDPLTFAQKRKESFAGARAVYIDCGRSDEYNILYGSRRLKELVQPVTPHLNYQEFEGGHGTIGPRYEISLPFLVKALQPMSEA